MVNIAFYFLSNCCSQEVYESLLKEIELFEFNNVTKTRLVSSTTEKQHKKYMEMIYNKEESINKVHEEIESLQKELNFERQQRKNKEEYDAVIAIINQHPSRDTTHKEIETLNRELSVLEKNSSNISTKVDKRKKQFALLLYSINQLEQLLKEDEKDDVQDNTTTAEDNTTTQSNIDSMEIDNTSATATSDNSSAKTITQQEEEEEDKEDKQDIEIEEY